MLGQLDTIGAPNVIHGQLSLVSLVPPIRSMSEAHCYLMFADVNWIPEDNETNRLVTRRSCQWTVVRPVLPLVVCTHYPPRMLCFCLGVHVGWLVGLSDNTELLEKLWRNPSHHRPPSYQSDCLHRYHDCSVVFLLVFLVLLFRYIGRLNWLPTSFWLHVKYLAYILIWFGNFMVFCT